MLLKPTVRELLVLLRHLLRTAIMATVVYAIVAGTAVPVAASNKVTVKGYYKSFFVAFDQSACKGCGAESSQPTTGSVNNRLRLEGRLRLSNRIDFNLAYDLAPRVQDPGLFDETSFRGNVEPGSYRLTDLDRRLYPALSDTVGSFAVMHNLDRAVLTVKASGFDVYIGRQAIAWGSGHAINPTDVFVPFNYGELDTEDRVGVDAVRVRVPLGFMAEIDAGYVFGDEGRFSRSAAYARTKFYVGRTDLSLMAVAFREHLLLGWDVTRPFGGAGFWMEGATVLLAALNEDEVDDGADYFRGSVGCDYSLWGGIYLFAEYHYNGPGARRTRDYLDNLSTAAYTDGGTFLMGRHYFVPGISIPATPLLTVGGEALVNLTDPSVLLVPGIDYSLAQDVYLAIGAYIGVGSSPRSSTNGSQADQVRWRSEFGGYPDMYYTSFRVYF
ncbi:MAG: hypothetical protein ABII79_08095 [bacterium]